MDIYEELYIRFIKYAKSKCQKLSFSLPYYDDAHLRKCKAQCKNFLFQCEPFIINEYEGDVNGRRDDWIYVVRFDWQLIEPLIAVGGLNKFQLKHSLPENLCLFADDKLWYESDTHDEWQRLFPRDNEDIACVKSFKYPFEGIGKIPLESLPCLVDNRIVYPNEDCDEWHHSFYRTQGD